MSGFKRDKFDIHEETDSISDRGKVAIETAASPVVQAYEYAAIKSSGAGDYKAVKAKYGSLAATDKDQSSRAQRDQRFSLNSLLRAPLSIEDEERRVIDERVQQQVATLAKKAESTARELGFKEGQKKGYDEAYSKMQAEARVSLEKIENLVSEFESAKATIFQANERFLIELIFRIARSVLLRELTTDHDYMLRLAKELIERVGTKENITIRVNTDDIKTMELLKEGLEKRFTEINHLKIEHSSHVPQGGCQVETEWNAIDASIEAQLSGIYSALMNDSNTSGLAKAEST